MGDAQKFTLIKRLIDSLNKLDYDNWGELNAFFRRAEMIVSKTHGESSKYIKELNSVSFRPMYFSVGNIPESEDRESWDSGKKEMQNILNTILEDLEIDRELEQDTTHSASPKKPDKEISNNVFIVHGRDEEMKLTVARTVTQLGLNPIILHERPNKGKTIIEKFEDEASGAGFAIVLLSPDDMVYPKDKSSEEAMFRARQNVILELGFFIGKLGRKHVFPLVKKIDKFEFPSDYDGVVYVTYDGGGWKFRLGTELKACGYSIDLNKLM